MREVGSAELGRAPGLTWAVEVGGRMGSWGGRRLGGEEEEGVEEEYPLGRPQRWRTWQVQRAPVEGAGGRSTPKSGPLERQREAGRREEGEGVVVGWRCAGSAEEGARWAWRPGTGAGEEGRREGEVVGWRDGPVGPEMGEEGVEEPRAGR